MYDSPIRGVIDVPKLTVDREERQRERIESETAVLMRSRGIGRVSISEAMRAADLTHGAFYCHYEGKGDLEAAACERVFGRSLEDWQKKFRESHSKQEPAAWLIDDYFSDKSISDAGHSCPIASLASDIGRLEPDDRTRQVFGFGFERLLNVVAETFQGDDEERFRQASTLLGTLIGTVILIRATTGKPVAQRIRNAVRDELQETYKGRTKCLERT
jgi:TetR/AcrR family transcriptional repressor of nem operon